MAEIRAFVTYLIPPMITVIVVVMITRFYTKFKDIYFFPPF